MKSIRLEVRHRSLLLDDRDFVFITEDGTEVEKTTTEGVVAHVERFVKRRLRGSARVHGRAQIPLFDVAKILGHTSIAVTMKYAHFAPEAGKAAVEALDRMLRSGAPEGDRVAEGEARLLADVRQASWLAPAVDLVRSA